MMGWGSMYFTGYRSPTEWAELGLMGDKLSFTDDDTVNKLGIGYIKNQTRECAMDTAVRYTLLNAGENGEINAKQMLNQHTRLAALVEEGIVADGWYEDNEGTKQRGWVYHWMAFACIGIMFPVLTIITTHISVLMFLMQKLLINTIAVTLVVRGHYD